MHPYLGVRLVLFKAIEERTHNKAEERQHTDPHPIHTWVARIVGESVVLIIIWA